ncbi:MAG: restriction endonuclease subunit S [Gammaproteobacteria bacterium]|nr:restriction endonuclease subunit S [Gammaproteobacteria bacterium]MBU1732630.1 restriction endonuclease subunit S [Gammaproteobacteria bacterium]MBU1893493.1 restriction endonuclease subunit S [Gammaproteobacteria bacterium]
MSWSVRPLREIADFALGKMLDQAKNKGELLPYLANINVRWGEFDMNDLREMRFESSELERFSLKYGDIVMCEGGEPGRCALWKMQQSGMMFQKALHRIRPNDCLDSRFLYYSFLNLRKTNGFEPYFTGATIKHLPREQLAKVVVRFPDIKTQEAIASVLENYDDLIITNQRRIQLLEDAARRLYREWFVHQRFPGHELVAVKEGVPEGWAILTLNDVCEAIGGGTPSTARPEYWGGDVVWVTPTDVTRNDCLVMLDSEKKITETGLTNSSSKLVPAETILMTSRASIGFFALMDQPVCTNQGFISIIPRHDNTRMFLLFNLMERVEEMIALATGATFKELSKRTFRALPVLWPTSELLNEFESKVYPLIQQTRLIKKQSEQLKRARDLLLPKLMSGQLDVSGTPLPEELAA